MPRLRRARGSGFSASQVAAACAVILAVAGQAEAADIVINNGLAPPNPVNVIDDHSYYSDDVYVRNAGCPPFGALNPWDPCPSPGVQTEVEVAEGGDLYYLSVWDSSIITGTGGSVFDLQAHGFSTVSTDGGQIAVTRAYDSATVVLDGVEGDCNAVYAYGSSNVTLLNPGSFQRFYEVRAYNFSVLTMAGGNVWEELSTYDSSTITMTGGTVGEGIVARGSSRIVVTGGHTAMCLIAQDSATITISGSATLDYDECMERPALRALGSSVIEIIGTSFAVNGVPVPYGPVSATAGTVTGKLASGEPLDTTFGRDSSATIKLVFASPPVPALSGWSYLALVSCLVAFGFAWLAMQRRRKASSL
jgi:hypothetical protein